MAKKKFTFRFWQNKTFYYLTAADGHGFYVRWAKVNVSEEDALKEADQHVGQILRNQKPDRISYSIMHYQPSDKQITADEETPVISELQQ